MTLSLPVLVKYTLSAGLQRHKFAITSAARILVLAEHLLAKIRERSRHADTEDARWARMSLSKIRVISETTS